MSFFRDLKVAFHSLMRSKGLAAIVILTLALGIGANAAISSGLSAWLAQLTSRTHRNVVAVALANKLARSAWAVLAKNEPYRHPVLADAAAA